ncbi:MAG: HlyD family type I secretion periplasmic adaptor subunit [Rhodospirillaceae bacterium]|nr:HlyD family type I secretion periplasmic adaptor subunit [Rhodospirillaceae bacterium]
MSRLEAMLAERPASSHGMAAVLVCVLIGSFLVWASTAQLDEVSVATGEVVPQGQLKVVQHFEGGIVQRIDVAEGDSVIKGQVLVQLDLAGGGVNREELIVQLDALTLRRVRLKAQVEGRAPVFPKAEAERRPELVRSEQQSHEAWSRERKGSLFVVSKQIQQRELEIKQLDAQKYAVAADERLARQRLKMSASLMSQGLIPRMEHLELEGVVEKLAGESAVLLQSVPRAQAALAESQARYNEDKERFITRSIEQLNAVELQFARVNELLSKASDQVLRAEIRSPINGVVKNLRNNTIGGVVRPGEPIMEIVPAGGNLVIESQLNPVDRGYVQVGQRAVVKISTYDFVRYGGLEGVVTRIGADTNTAPTGETYYEVIVQTEKSYLGKQKGVLPIAPGMQATVDIHTGTRSVLNYLIKPVLKLRHEAFRER